MRSRNNWCFSWKYINSGERTESGGCSLDQGKRQRCWSGGGPAGRGRVHTGSWEGGPASLSLGRAGAHLLLWPCFQAKAERQVGPSTPCSVFWDDRTDFKFSLPYPHPPLPYQPPQLLSYLNVDRRQDFNCIKHSVMTDLCSLPSEIKSESNRIIGEQTHLSHELCQAFPSLSMGEK